jgi:hypothetical protein
VARLFPLHTLLTALGINGEILLRFSKPKHFDEFIRTHDLVGLSRSRAVRDVFDTLRLKDDPLAVLRHFPVLIFMDEALSVKLAEQKFLALAALAEASDIFVDFTLRVFLL